MDVVIMAKKIQMTIVNAHLARETPSIHILVTNLAVYRISRYGEGLENIS
jgi:hypothetical protein